MKLHALVATAILGAAASLAGATTPTAADEYYIARDPDSTTCTIVDTRPRGPLRIIGNIFNSRAEAEARLAAVCHDEAVAPVVDERERVAVPDDDDETVVTRERVVPRDDDEEAVIERRTVEPADDDEDDDSVVVEERRRVITHED